MICPRDLVTSIAPFLKRKEYLAIIGPRQSGKTTLLGIIQTHLRKELKTKRDQIAFITFEDRRLLAQFESDPVAFARSFLPRHAARPFYLMIDEFQYAIDGGQKLKLIYDTIGDLKIIITGSSSLDIKAQVGRYMVGRMVTFHLFPFSFGEALHLADRRTISIYHDGHTKIASWLQDNSPVNIKSRIDIFGEEMIDCFENYCIWGGFPTVVSADDIDVKRKLLSDIYDGYVLKDIKSLLGLTTEKNLYLLSQYLATQIGNIVVYQNLGQAAGLDFRNLKKHLHILRETLICQELKPFFRNRQKELSKNPKIYFWDLGFRNNLMEDFNTLDRRPDRGAIIENYVFIRLQELFRGYEKINFWRTKVGAEVDFVLRVKDQIIPIEVKYSDFSSEKITRSMASFIDAFNPTLGIVLTKNYWGMMQNKKTRILFAPIYYL